LISTKIARQSAFQQGQKDFHAGWTRTVDQLATALHNA